MRYNIGIDIGSTTIKAVVLNDERRLVADSYVRHQMRIKESLAQLLSDFSTQLGNADVAICMTGSVGMGVAERHSLQFMQEVVAASNYLKSEHPEAATMIDIGGEDAKMVFMNNGKPSDLRMNGNCAGGTGAFIDQMAVLLNTTANGLGELAEKATTTYPIASRVRCVLQNRYPESHITQHQS